VLKGWRAQRLPRQVFAYDLTMRRLFLCFLLCLVPLRLWAGVWMPMAQSVAHHPETTVSASPAPHAEAVHDCHETMAESGSAYQAQGWHDVQNATADCHDGNCQLCGVCHQSLSLAAWPWRLPVVQAQPWPVAVLQAHAAMALSPLIKPPIS